MSDDQQIDEIREDIEDTRADMSRTIDQLEARLSPDALQEQASELINRLSEQLLAEFSTKSEEISTRISDQMQSAVNSAATQKLDQLFTQAGDTAKTAGDTIWRRLSDNPVPVALAAVGIGLLAAEGGAAKEQVSHLAQGVSDRVQQATGGSQTDGQEGGQGLLESAKQMVGERVTDAESRLQQMTEQAGDALHGVADQAAEKAHGVAGQAKAEGDFLKGSISSMPSDIGGGAERSRQNGQNGQNGQGGMLSGLLESPGLGAGLLALGLGLVAGLGVPETQKEKELAAPLRERAMEQLDAMGITDTTGQGGGLIDQVKQTGQEIVGEAKQTGGELLDEAKATAQDVASQVKETADSVKHDAHEAASNTRKSATTRT